MISHLLFTIHSGICFKILRQNRIRNDREGLRRPASHAEGEEDSLAALGAEQLLPPAQARCYQGGRGGLSIN